jgi:hypothetical protein
MMIIIIIIIIITTTFNRFSRKSSSIRDIAHNKEGATV